MPNSKTFSSLVFQHPGKFAISKFGPKIFISLKMHATKGMGWFVGWAYALHFIMYVTSQKISAPLERKKERKCHHWKFPVKHNAAAGLRSASCELVCDLLQRWLFWRLANGALPQEYLGQNLDVH